jgi:hypothetical protein
MTIPNRVEPVIHEKEIKMNDRNQKHGNIDAIGWGALFIWWGLTLVIQLPAGVGLVGIGLILLAANAAVYFQGMRINGFTTAIGVLALVWGGLELAGTALGSQLPVFPILLVVLGLLVAFGRRAEDAIGGKASK